MTRVVGAAAVAVFDPDTNTRDPVTRSSTVGTLTVWPLYNSSAATPGLAASRESTDTPSSFAIFKKVSPLSTSSVLVAKES